MPIDPPPFRNGRRYWLLDEARRYEAETGHNIDLKDIRCRCDLCETIALVVLIAATSALGVAVALLARAG